MSHLKITDKSLYTGIFYPTSDTLWQHVNPIASKVPAWLYIADEHTVLTVKSALKKHIQKGVVEPNTDWGLREYVFRLSDVLSKIKEKLQPFIIENNKPLMIFLEMSWVIRTPAASIYLRNFLIELQKLTETCAISICCLYNETILLDEQLILGLQAHPFIFTIEGIKSNPHYLPPTVFEQNTLRAQFNYWMAQIEPNRLLSLAVENAPPQYFSTSDETVYHIDKSLYSPVAQSEEGRWKIRCLGDLKVYRNNGVLIDWETKGGATKKVKTLFAYLLFKAEKGASVEELADLLWSDTLDMTQSTNRLYHTIRCLRQSLEGKDDQLRQSPFIIHQNTHYYLNLPQDSWIDLPMFQELCYKGNEHLKTQNWEQSLICYQSAERLYQGDLLTDIPQKYTDNTEMDWCWSRRFWYRDMHHKLLYSLAAIHRQLGNISESLKYGDKALVIEPCSEPAQREKLLSLKAAHRIDAVHRQYKMYCESLKKFDLGAPSQMIKDIYEKIVKT